MLTLDTAIFQKLTLSIMHTVFYLVGISIFNTNCDWLVKGFIYPVASNVIRILLKFHSHRMNWVEQNWTCSELQTHVSSVNFVWCEQTFNKLECGPMPNVMAALPNIGGALCSMPQFGWRPLLECRAVTLPRCQTRWNLQGCPKLTKWSQLLVGRSSPYYGYMWRRYCCLTSFLRLST